MSIKIKNLSICYNLNQLKINAVNNLNIKIKKGSSLGIVGESGSGKTSVAMAIMGLLKNKGQVEGEIFYEDIELNGLSEKEKNLYRWGKIAMVFQNSLDVLNPVLTVKEQILECILKHTELAFREAEKRVLELLNLVGLESKWSSFYPHHLSGGMRQRVLLAMALSCNPKVLIVDEPTSSLDFEAKSEIIELIKKLHKKKRFTLILISHEMKVISELSSRIMVMYSGYVLEEGVTKDVLAEPMHTYTRGLINASPSINPYRDLWGIPGEVESNQYGGCAFYDRCGQRTLECRTKLPELKTVLTNRKVACNRGGITVLLEGMNINKSYQFKDEKIKPCNNCNIKVYSGEVVVLTGKSGSGKTTLASILSGVLDSDSGEVFFEGEKVKGNSATSKENGVQIIFQDPFTATNELLNVSQVVAEPLDILKIGSKEERFKKVKKVIRDVQLPSHQEFLERDCHSLSGGQRQRVAIARSLILNPKMLIADEISSMLDPSTQANILRLLKGLQNSRNFAMLYITHDLDLAKKIADRTYNMLAGRVLEAEPTDLWQQYKSV
ncbi:ABC transporter ATP-binding protein [Herbivorax sp. ANBcel31]|uniref:ABC transporter ATP-binding protein n=1 Tax=Herbivorax sp. ANBcel31 TaxID=3069754 RepID=UPI0027AFE875|nr:ABC transporter ATP-binding protein [Herbivorax sp. ANBcel31]MDQ2085591.1 ABC transporter ATP-binding protein [Herbivorax sp. ANBcel31]